MDEDFTDTQRMLAHVFLDNCGIKIAKEAIAEVQYIEDISTLTWKMKELNGINRKFLS